jgi:hypothetical protein
LKLDAADEACGIAAKADDSAAVFQFRIGYPSTKQFNTEFPL